MTDTTPPRGSGIIRIGHGGRGTDRASPTGWPIARVAPQRFHQPLVRRSEAELDAAIERAMADAANDDAARRRAEAAAQALDAEWRAQTDPANANWRIDVTVLAAIIAFLGLMAGLGWALSWAIPMLAQVLP